MNTLTWVAFSCYAAGLGLGALGIKGIYGAAVLAKRRMDQIETPGPHSAPADIANMGAMRPLVSVATTKVVWAMLSERRDWRTPALLIVAGILVEFAGNVLSLPW